MLETKTLDRAEGPVISVRLKPGRRGKRKRGGGPSGVDGGRADSCDGGSDAGRNSASRESDGANVSARASELKSSSDCYTVFVLQKCDTDHHTALDLLGKAIG